MDSLSRCLDAESTRRLAEFRIAAPVQERVPASKGLTDVGRTTVLVLGMNHNRRLELRALRRPPKSHRFTNLFPIVFSPLRSSPSNSAEPLVYPVIEGA